MIFVDSNIPMYLVGDSEPHKRGAQRLLQGLLDARERLVSDAELLQEILHRYVSINRREAIQPAFDALFLVVDEVLPVDRAIAERAKEVVFSQRRLSARDALHVAVMQRHGIERILSYDAGFDGVPGIHRSH
jgi:uncharacterized protein